MSMELSQLGRKFGEQNAAYSTKRSKGHAPKMMISPKVEPPETLIAPGENQARKAKVKDTKLPISSKRPSRVPITGPRRNDDSDFCDQSKEQS